MLKKFEKKTAPLQVKPILDYLKDQNTLLDECGKLLFKESNALKSRNADLIDELAKKKAELLNKIVGNDQKIKLHPDKAQLTDKFKRHVEVIKLKLEECRRRNEVNGKLIAYAMGSNKRLMDVLMKARDRTTKNLTYTEEGRTVATGLSRVNIQA